MPFREARIGESRRGATTATEAFRTLFVAEEATRLKWLVAGGLQVGAPQASGTGAFTYRVMAFVVASLGTSPDIGAAGDSNTGGVDVTDKGTCICDQRVIASSVQPVILPLSWTLNRGEGVLVIITDGNDTGAGSATRIDASCHVCGDPLSMDLTRMGRI